MLVRSSSEGAKFTEAWRLPATAFLDLYTGSTL